MYEGVLLLPIQSVFCYQLFHGYSLLTASELCGRPEHPVGSSVEVSDSAADWNVEQMNLITVFLSVVLCSNQSAYRRRSSSESFLAPLVYQNECFFKLI